MSVPRHQRQVMLRLSGGMMLSIAAHALVGVPLLMHALSTAAPADETAASTPDPSLPPLIPEDQPTPLGIDDGAPSTLTWVGMDEYEEHLAELSDLEQAAMEMNPSMPTPPTVVPVETEQPSEAEAVEQTQDAAQPIVDEAREETTAAAETALVEREDVEDPPTAREEHTRAPVVRPTMDFSDMMAALQEVWARQAMLAAAQPEQEQPIQPDAARVDETIKTGTDRKPTPDDAETKVDVQQPADAEANADDAPAAPPPPSVDPAKPATAADRESDPFSKIEVPFDHLKLGKPLAMEGLSLRTVRPTFTVLQTVTGLPRNPRVQIQFDSKGVPKDAKILEASGWRWFDDAVRSSLFKWRAEGNRIKDMQPDDVLIVELRIVVHP